MEEYNKKLYSLIDLLCSEYGWTIEYCLKLPLDIINGLSDCIQKRQRENFKLETKLMAVAISCSFSGKLDKIDKIFTSPVDVEEEVDPDAWKNQVKSLWLRTKKQGDSVSSSNFKELNDEFEKEWALGNIKF